ncbi:MAG: type II secretion system protein [Terriglobales bacterium]
MVTVAKFQRVRRKAQAGAPVPHSRRGRALGFTLIELMIVISIMVILISIAVPLYQQSIIRAREAALKQDLFTMRSSINLYTEDKQKAPQSLDDLVSAGYMRNIPTDPFTQSNSTWTVDTEEMLLSVDQTEPGITDVHSGATGTSTEGTPYNTW